MSERVRRLSRLAPILLVAALAAAWLLPSVAWLRLSPPDPLAADRMTAALDALGDEPRVLVGFDADLGTYSEIRPTVRALLADLIARRARLAFVSLTAEGRALASAELARLGRGEADAERLIDLGFIPGAEAGLVDLSRDLRPPEPGSGEFAGEVGAEGIDAFGAVLVIGGNDVGPRSWMEQVATRIGDIPFLAVTPTILLPEVQPYLASGGLAALLGTPGDGTAYRASLDSGNLGRLADPSEPRPLPVLVGLLVAIAVLGQALAARAVDYLRISRAREVG